MVPELEKLIAQSSRIVFFGGAGVSTESGIPDFRSVDGLYHQKFDYPPEVMLSHEFFVEHTAEFYRFYREKLIVHGAGPNAAHRRLAAQITGIHSQGFTPCRRTAPNRPPRW